MYRKLKSDIYAVKEIHDPTVRQPKERIVEKASNCIVVKKSEVSLVVVSRIYLGLSRRIIQHGLNSMKQQQKVRPLIYFLFIYLPHTIKYIINKHNKDYNK